MDEDEPSADEADPGDDLGGDTGRIEDDKALVEDVVEAVFGDKQEEGGGGSDDGVGAQAGTFLVQFALEADGGGEDKGGSDLKELPRKGAMGERCGQARCVQQQSKSGGRVGARAGHP